MFSSAGKLLESGETIRSTVHPSRLRIDYLKRLALGVVLAAGVSGGILMAQDQVLPSYLSQWMLYGLFIIPGFVLGWNELEHHFVMYHFTDRKFILEQGIFTKDFSTVPYDKITQVGIRQSLDERLAGIGTLEVEVVGTDNEELVLRGIRHPQKFRAKLAAAGDKEAEEIVPEEAQSGTITQEQLEAELGRTQHRRQQLEEQYEQGEIGQDEYKRQWYILEGEERALSKQIDKFSEKDTA